MSSAGPWQVRRGVVVEVLNGHVVTFDDVSGRVRRVDAIASAVYSSLGASSRDVDEIIDALTIKSATLPPWSRDDVKRSIEELARWALIERVE